MRCYDKVSKDTVEFCPRMVRPAGASLCNEGQNIEPANLEQAQTLPTAITLKIPCYFLKNNVLISINIELHKF